MVEGGRSGKGGGSKSELAASSDFTLSTGKSKRSKRPVANLKKPK